VAQAESRAFVALKKMNIHQTPVDVRWELDVMVVERDAEHKSACMLGIFSIEEDNSINKSPR
jgi:hypothetical protein